MAPVTQYVFAEMLGISEHFTAGSHEWLPYSVIPIFPKLICKQQFIFLPPNIFRLFPLFCEKPLSIPVECSIIVAKTI